MAGCYGKIPALGDFLSRNLSAGFVELWDGWLRRVLLSCAQPGGDQWVDQYLSSPIWRFAMTPGVIGHSGRAGILVPSVDSVGRCFPLTICTDFPSSLPVIDVAAAWADGYERAEMMAIGALGRALDPESFVARVASLPPVASTPISPERPVERWVSPAASGIGVRIDDAPGESGRSWELASVLALEIAMHSRDGLSLWWHLDWEGRPASTVMFAGLPPPEAAASMLLGSWEERGWSR